MCVDSELEGSDEGERQTHREGGGGCVWHVFGRILTLFSLQREYMQDRLSWEREEKLVVSAWYEMVSNESFLFTHTHARAHTHTHAHTHTGAHDAPQVFAGETFGSSQLIPESAESLSLQETDLHSHPLPCGPTSPSLHVSSAVFCVCVHVCDE